MWPRKRPPTAVERIADRLMDKGLEIEMIRQPVHPKPGFVTFSDSKDPKTCVTISVLETFLELNDALIEKVREAETTLEAARCRKKEGDDSQ